MLKLFVPVLSRRLFLTAHCLGVQVKHTPSRCKIISISGAVTDDLKKRGASNTIFTVPNGIPSDLIPMSRPKKYCQGDTFRILQVGRLKAEEKGQDILVRALAILKKRGINYVEVDFIGEGPSEEMLRQLAKDTCVESQVNFLGLRSRPYIYTHLPDYHLMAHPARFEGFGLVVAEAMAAGVPVLVPETGGPAEIIKHGELGTICKYDSAEDCAAKIYDIISDYARAASIVPQARREVEEMYSCSLMTKKYLEIYLK